VADEVSQVIFIVLLKKYVYTCEDLKWDKNFNI
jgi:hypothetical protein